MHSLLMISNTSNRCSKSTTKNSSSALFLSLPVFYRLVWSTMSCSTVLKEGEAMYRITAFSITTMNTITSNNPIIILVLALYDVNSLN